MQNIDTVEIRVSKKFKGYLDDVRGELSRAEMLDIVYAHYIEPSMIIRIGT